LLVLGVPVLVDLLEFQHIYFRLTARYLIRGRSILVMLHVVGLLELGEGDTALLVRDVFLAVSHSGGFRDKYGVCRRGELRARRSAHVCCALLLLAPRGQWDTALFHLFVQVTNK
jgi:hypothetical protein